MSATPYRIELRRRRMIEERCIIDVPGHFPETEAIARAMADAEIYHQYAEHTTLGVAEPFHVQIRSRPMRREREGAA